MFLTKNDQGYVAFFYFSVMPKRTGVADLPLHTGTVPRWLADRMRDLGRRARRAASAVRGRTRR